MQKIQNILITLIPVFFVLLWSTGFIGAKYALPYAEPFMVLFIRMLFNLLVFALLIIILKRARLNRQQAMHQMVVGALVHAGYLGGVFAAIGWSLPAGLASLIVGLQPILTAIIAWQFLHQPLSPRQWLGLLIGLAGITLVLYGNDRLHVDANISGYAFVAILLALLSISIGTLYQKRFAVDVDLITGSFYQYLACGFITGVISYYFETGAINWQLPLILSIAWLVFGLSVVAVLLLLYMIRGQESARVASYFYLVPPVTAAQAWFLFDEKFSLLACIGVVITVIGVYLVTDTKQANITPPKA